MEEKFKQLFYEIFEANGENKLHEIVKNDEDLKDKNNWHPYGDIKANFGTFEGQQPTAEGSLVEKIINSIDALLLKKCKQEGIDPESEESPKTMEEAAKKFFFIPEDHIGDMPSKTKLAKKNIQVIATGEKITPDIMIYDYGEGQHPKEFKNTFLSLQLGNKANISFVQGKYNMGSTGAVAFCGEYRYQLICSKRDSKIFDIEKKSKELEHNFFGWTLVRRHQLSDIEDKKNKSTWYEYFAIDGKTIPYFKIESLDIGLFGDKKFTTGSFTKLYSYNLSTNFRQAISSGTGGLCIALNQLLFKPSLPIWVYEKREYYNYKGSGIITRAVYGNHTNFIKNQEKVLEAESPFVHYFEVEGDKIEVKVYVLKIGKSAPDKRAYIDPGKNIVYVINGQVHGHEGKPFITQNFSYGYIKDSMFIMIDCSDLKTSYRSDVFMSDRSNLRKSNKVNHLNDKVIKAIKDDKRLMRLNEERKISLFQGDNDSTDIESVKKLWKKFSLSDRPFKNSLTDDIKIIDTSHETENKINSPKITKRFPTIFKIKMNDDVNGKKIKSIPINSEGIIEFETDVDPNYIFDAEYGGELKIQILGSHNANDSSDGDDKGKPNSVDDVFDITRRSSNDGSIKLALSPKKNTVQVGDEIKLNSRLTSPDGDMECIFYVKIVDPKVQNKNQRERRNQRIKEPDIIKILKNDSGEYVKDNGDLWDSEKWDNDSVIQIFPTSDNKDVDAIAINMDSKHLKKYMEKSKANGQKAIENLKREYIITMYFHGIFQYRNQNILRIQDKELNNSEETTEDFVAKMFKTHADFLLNFSANKEILDNLDDD